MNKQFADHVAILAKPGVAIVNELSHQDCHRIHMVLGIAGEAGELVDAVKKAAIYQKPLDHDNIVEELGDLVFYMQGLMNDLGITWEAVMQHNITKLASRYPAGYSDKAAQERADKKQKLYAVVQKVGDQLTGRYTFGPTTDCAACEDHVEYAGGFIVELVAKS
jgi:NTP pyrophosphatase (non-canonical NTP hydrolase)